MENNDLPEWEQDLYAGRSPSKAFRNPVDERRAQQREELLARVTERRARTAKRKEFQRKYANYFTAGSYLAATIFAVAIVVSILAVLAMLVGGAVWILTGEPIF